MSDHLLFQHARCVVLPALASEVERNKCLGDIEPARDINLLGAAGNQRIDLRELGRGQLLALGTRNAQSALSGRIPHVVELGAEEEMRWVAAERGVAAMQDALAVRRRTVRQFVGNTMGAETLVLL